MKKKILFVIDTLTIGGANSSLSALYAEMKDYYDMNVFALTHDGDVSSHGFRDILLPKDMLTDAYFGDFAKASNKLKAFKFIVKIVKRLSIFLHINIEKTIYKYAVKKIERYNTFDNVVAFQEDASALFVSLFSCKKKIAWIHCDFTRGYPSSNARIYHYFNKIVFVSHYTELQFLMKYPHYKGKTCFAYNFLDESRIERLSHALILDIQFSDREFTVLSLGRIVPLKRFSKIPSIVARIKSKGINLKWIIIGPVFDEAEHKRLMDNINKYDVRDSVTWLGGKSNPYPYMKRAYLCVSLSTTEACPMVFNEARVLNVPIVTTDFGSAHEFVTDGVDGYIRPIEKIPDVISDICLDLGKYQNLHKNSVPKYIVNNEIKLKLISILN